MAVQNPVLRRKVGDTGTLNGSVLRRTGASTTVAEPLSGASVYITIKRDAGGGTLTYFDDVLIPAPDISALTGEFDYVLSANQVAELVAGRYLMTLRVVFATAEQRSYPNDSTPDDRTAITSLVLEVLAA